MTINIKLINSINDDMCLTVTVNAKTGYFTSNRKGGFGDRDIYKVDLTNYRVLDKEMKVVAPEVVDNGPVMAILKGLIFLRNSWQLAIIMLFNKLLHRS